MLHSTLLTEAELEHHQCSKVMAVGVVAEVTMLNLHELTMDVDRATGPLDNVATLPVLGRGVSSSRFVSGYTICGLWTELDRGMGSLTTKVSGMMRVTMFSNWLLVWNIVKEILVRSVKCWG